MAEDADLLEEARSTIPLASEQLQSTPAPFARARGVRPSLRRDYNYMTHTVPEWFSREDFYDVTAAIHRAT